MKHATRESLECERVRHGIAWPLCRGGCPPRKTLHVELEMIDPTVDATGWSKVWQSRTPLVLWLQVLSVTTHEIRHRWQGHCYDAVQRCSIIDGNQDQYPSKNRGCPVSGYE